MDPNDKLIFVTEIPGRQRGWDPPFWLKSVKEDQWLRVPISKHSEVYRAKKKLTPMGLEVRARTVDKGLYMFVRRVPKPRG